MENIKHLEYEISKLNSEELAEFRAWFEKYDSEIWDKQLQSDIESGKLDEYGQQAVKDYKNGKYKEI